MANLDGEMLVSFLADDGLQILNKQVKQVLETCVYSSTIITVAASASNQTIPISVTPASGIFWFQDLDDSGNLTIKFNGGGTAYNCKPVFVLSDAVTAATVSNASTSAKSLLFIIFGSST